ncbi:unnamed protein product [Mycena citricolor]|uniref:Mitochondrial carrier n=1 Tax=Mycena citricolor TaxID=2018698 RepID=A0AAD2HB77_9AGAR|nr:unnamed protein product [Mycena citricolor]
MHTDGAHSISGDDAAIMTLREAVKEITIGSFAGVVSEIVEYPADLAKVRLQAQLLTPPSETRQLFKGPVDTLVKTWRNEGVRGLYRVCSLAIHTYLTALTTTYISRVCRCVSFFGTHLATPFLWLIRSQVPIAGSMAETAGLFWSYSYFQNLIRAQNSIASSTPLTIPQVALAGASAGFVASFIVTPIELVKCKMQVQLMNTTTSARVPPIHSVPKSVASLVRTRPSESPLFDLIVKEKRPPGLVSIVRSTVATHGLKGLWLGHTGTILRETGGTASWFAVKEWVAERLLARRLGPGVKADLLSWESAVSGAISGAACVLALYPADTVKSAMQTEEELLSHRRSAGYKPRPPSFYRTFTEMYTRHGVKGLYAGGGMTMMRAVPSSGIVFVVYDGLSAWIG